jgi:outer membrane protein assembly factor BamE (lipoprotein component of BamABCDE complex)
MRLLQNNAFLALMCAVAFLLGAITFPTAIYRSLFDTEYSQGFDKSRWTKVKVGMSESEVVSLLGDPLSISEKGDQRTFAFSKSHSGNHSYVSYFVAIQNGRIVRKVREVSWD